MNDMLKKLIEGRQSRHADNEPISHVLAICEHLRVLAEGQEVRIDSLIQAQIKINERLHAVERLVSMYQEPRG
jgi:hypothetical protein